MSLVSGRDFYVAAHREVKPQDAIQENKASVYPSPILIPPVSTTIHTLLSTFFSMLNAGFQTGISFSPIARAEIGAVHDRSEYWRLISVNGCFWLLVSARPLFFFRQDLRWLFAGKGGGGSTGKDDDISAQSLFLVAIMSVEWEIGSVVCLR